MARITGHAAVLMGEACRLHASVAPCVSIFLDGLGQQRFLVVVRAARRDRVQYLHYLPLLALLQHGALNKEPSFQ